MKMSILVLLMATMVTTRFVEAHREPKVLVYEVSERDGEDPEIQLLKVEDVDEAMKEDEIYQDQALDKYQQYKSHNKKKNRNRHTSNRQSVKFADEYDIENYKDGKHKSHSKNNHFTSYKKLNSNYRNLKQKDTYRNRNLENIFIDWTKQQNYGDNQDQIYDYLQRKLQQNEKQNARSSKKKQTNLDDEYFDLGNVNVNREEDVLLSQLLKPLKRQKREAERSSIINKLKQLLRRLQELDDDGEARIDGKVYINKQSDANDWNQDGSDLADNTFKTHSIQINRTPALRSGDQIDLDRAEYNLEEILGDDRTMPPPSRSKYDIPDY